MFCSKPGSFEKFNDIYINWSEGSPEARYKAISMIYSLLSGLSKQKSKHKKSRISGGIEYINQNFRSPQLTVSDAASAANVSEVFFRRLMNRDYGIPPLAYINRLRIEAAKELLESGYYSITEIAEVCGFSDLKYFSHAFKKAVGMTATQYKRKFE